MVNDSINLCFGKTSCKVTMVLATNLNENEKRRFPVYTMDYGSDNSQLKIVLLY